MADLSVLARPRRGSPNQRTTNHQRLHSGGPEIDAARLSHELTAQRNTAVPIKGTAVERSPSNHSQRLGLEVATSKDVLTVVATVGRHQTGVNAIVDILAQRLSVTVTEHHVHNSRVE